MATDPSIYNALGVGVAPIANPQDQLAKALQTGNALIGFKNNAAQIGARNALAAAYAGAPVDPATGMPDQKAVLSSLAADPRGAWMMPQVIQGLQEQQKRGFDLQKQQFDQTTARTNVANNAFTPLLRLGNNVTPTDIVGQVAGLHASGFPTDEIVQDMSATMPPRQPGMSDQQYGAQLQGWLTNHASRSWGADTSASKFTPNVTPANNGGHIVYQDTNALTNPGIVGSSLRMQMTPPEEAGQVKGPLNAQGQPTVIPRSTYAQQNGLGNLVPDNGPGGSGQPSAFGANGGRLPPLLLNPNRPGASQPAPVPGSVGPGSPGYAPAQPASAAQGGGFTTASTAPAPANPQGAPQGYATPLPPPGPAAPNGYAPMTPAAAPQGGPAAPMAVDLSPSQKAAQAAAGTASANQLAALQNSVGGSGARMYQLQAGLQGLQQGGPTGPSSGTINNMKSYLLSLPVVGQNLGIDPNQVANYDEANKYLTAYAAARAGAHGGATDQQLATTLSSNASTHISGLAAQNVVKANIGLERMDQAQLAGFQNGLDPVTGQPTGQQFTPDQFATYSTKWNTAQDPRAFVADQLSPQQFAATVSGMQPAERARFQQTFNTAMTNGWIDPPAWLQPPAANGAAPAGSAPQTAPSQSAAPSASPPSTAPLPPPVLNHSGRPIATDGF